MVLKKTGEINNLISQLRFPPQKPVSPSTIKKTKQNKTKIRTKIKTNKQTNRQKNKQKKKTMLIVLAVFTNACDFLRFGVVYFALLVDARAVVTF